MSNQDRPEQAERLIQARLARGFASAMDAIRYFNFNENTYKGHEAGTRGLVRAADRYARAFRVSEAWLLTGEGEAPQAPKIPVMGFAAGAAIGSNIIHNKAIDYATAPPALAHKRGAYALFVRGTSMQPQFFENDLIFVNPDKQPKPGDAVVIQQHSNGEITAFVKIYTATADGIIHAAQHNPRAQMQYPQKSIIAMHRVMTINELFGIT